MVPRDARAPSSPFAMLSRTEIAQGVSGAWRLIWGDGGGLYMLDRTREGFWRSFRVMLLMAPLQVFCLLIVYARVQTIAPDSVIVLVEALRYIIDWTLFPVLLLEIARVAGWQTRYIGAVVAINWFNVPLIILSTMSLTIGELLPTGLGAGPTLILLAFFVYGLTRILRETLSISPIQSLLLSMISLSISLILEFVVNGIVGRLPGA
jgi:hypothetical protein